MEIFLKLPFYGIIFKTRNEVFPEKAILACIKENSTEVISLLNGSGCRSQKKKPA
jgi:hypothetical protein